jgi:hypothetical protein
MVANLIAAVPSIVDGFMNATGSQGEPALPNYDQSQRDLRTDLGGLSGTTGAFSIGGDASSGGAGGGALPSSWQSLLPVALTAVAALAILKKV